VNTFTDQKNKMRTARSYSLEDTFRTGPPRAVLRGRRRFSNISLVISTFTRAMVIQSF
jgi:hypothetical protein